MKSARRHSAGFTLVELMIALVAGAMAVVGVYYLGDISARAYNEQMRVGDTQLALRSALEQLRRDVGRAGFLSLRDSTEHADCPSGTGRLRDENEQLKGIAIQNNASATNPNVSDLLNMAANTTRVDKLQMLGNYVTADAYQVDTAGDPALLTIAFQVSKEAFRRSFVDPGVPGVGTGEPTYNPARFEAAFSGRWVRVEWDGQFWFRKVASVSANTTPPSITLETPLPSNPNCFQYGAGDIGVAMVSPLSRISYAVEEIATTGELSRLHVVDPSEPQPPGVARAVLLRREEDVADETPVAGTTRLVLDYAVEFAVDAVVDTGGAPRWALADPADLDTLNASTIRALRVTLSARTIDANPRLPRIARTSLASPFMAFKINAPGTAELWAPVRSLRTEFFLPNMAARPR